MTTASPTWSRSAGAMSLIGAMTFHVHPTGEATTTTTPRVSSRRRQLHVERRSQSDNYADQKGPGEQRRLHGGNRSDTAEKVGELQRCTRGETWRQPAKIVVVDRQE